MIPANFVFPRADSDGPAAATVVSVSSSHKQAVKLQEMPLVLLRVVCNYVFHYDLSL